MPNGTGAVERGTAEAAEIAEKIIDRSPMDDDSGGSYDSLATLMIFSAISAASAFQNRFDSIVPKKVSS